MVSYVVRIWVVISLCLVVSPIAASDVNCLSYLRAERLFLKETGKTPDHRDIEAALSRLPFLATNFDGDPWQKYLSASFNLDWATERQQALRKEDARQKLLGRSVPNYSIKSSVAHKSVLESLKNKNSAGKMLNKWLIEHGIDEKSAKIFQWFVSTYRDAHKVLQNNPPDLVYRVAVHERETKCPS